jgi:hypothetical protein
LLYGILRLEKGFMREKRSRVDFAESWAVRIVGEVAFQWLQNKNGL